ncbi:MAG: enoyl-CoA hydratase/isomerase family protein [Perlucidibaca sp.]
MNTSDVVAFEYLPLPCGRRLALATLDSERSLNALTLDMVEALLPRLAAWAADDSVLAVLLRGRGERAFCAGGDVRRLTEAARTGSGDPAYAARFFAREYRLDYAIHRFPKPLLVWGTGVVMGGGLGLFSGARFRIATDTTRMAMPEITIGLFPDVGGSYFLSRLPGRLGLFLGLSALQFGAADARFLGLASHVLPSGGWDALLAGLSQLDWTGDADAQAGAMDALLRTLQPADLAPGPLEQHEAHINALAGHDSLQALDQAWRADPLPEEAWLARALSNYRAGSPTSAALIWRQWHQSAEQTLAEVFRTEWMLSSQCVLHPDFPEGVRALLIDKDLKPRWQPETLAGVDEAWLAAHYQVPADLAQPLDDLEACYGA